MDGDLTPSLEIDLGAAKPFNRLLLAEYIPLGQRVTAVRASYMNETGDWVSLVQATTVGYKRILSFDEVTARRIRIEFEALACPTISSVSVYNAPKL